MTNVHNQDLAVKYGTLDALTTELGGIAGKLEDDIKALRADVQKIAEAWGGEAYDAFTKQHKKWDMHANGIHQALVTIGQRIHEAGGDYRSGDLKGASYFQ
ncbi:WXG100 family type VII secretion target [Streptomyces triticisoli]|jgi:WXG100 family type VII secretion target|uniref:WXG100 family type VII secretion target n=1 Tax=Streptomyces triticisoli TaxID=2182797 RepID=UPI000DD628E6|nr:WXG100 family type VII secretion target [Streptomyces triticisoli]